MDQPKNKIYETTFIVNATLDDAQIDQMIDRFREFLTKNGAEVRTMDKWGRKRLAYPIEKKNNGYYAVCEFSGPSDLLAKLERHYSLDENVMRFLTVQLTEKLIRARQEQERKAAAESAPPAPPPPPPVQKPESKTVPPGSQTDDDDDDDT